MQPDIPPPSRAELWHEPFELGSITDLAGLFLGLLVFAFTVWVAMRQLGIMRAQTAMMNEQNEASKRMESITQRQGEIAEAQHRIFVEQSARRPVLEIGEGNVLIVPERGFERYRLEVSNQGNLAAQWCDWEVLVPLAYNGMFTFRPVDGDAFVPNVEALTERDGRRFFQVDGRINEPIHPRQAIRCVDIEKTVDSEVEVYWIIYSDHGRVPEKSFGRFVMTATVLGPQQRASD